MKRFWKGCGLALVAAASFAAAGTNLYAQGQAQNQAAGQAQAAARVEYLRMNGIVPPASRGKSG